MASSLILYGVLRVSLWNVMSTTVLVLPVSVGALSAVRQGSKARHEKKDS